jgi:hypothetical protein
VAVVVLETPREVRVERVVVDLAAKTQAVLLA